MKRDEQTCAITHLQPPQALEWLSSASVVATTWVRVQLLEPKVMVGEKCTE